MAKFEIVLHDAQDVYDIWLTGTEQPADLMREGGKICVLDVTDVRAGAEFIMKAAREWIFLCYGKFCSPVQPRNFRDQGHEDVENKDPCI